MIKPDSSEIYLRIESLFNEEKEMIIVKEKVE
jgi:hypothetical protein